MISPRIPLLDTQTFTRLRIQERLSLRALARAAGVSETVIAGIERGENHRNISLGILTALADALGTTISELTRASACPATPGPDDATLEAALATLHRPVRSHEVALALDWPLDRTRAAASALAERLRGTGQTLIRTEWDQLRIVPADALTHDQRLRMAQSSPKARGLTPRTASVLTAFLADELNADWLRRASRTDRTSLSSLINMGILRVRQSPTQIVLAPEFEYLRRTDPSTPLFASLDD